LEAESGGVERLRLVSRLPALVGLDQIFRVVLEAATLWPLIVNGEVSFLITLPLERPPLDSHDTLSPL
jgi:hypothetical protein